MYIVINVTERSGDAAGADHISSLEIVNHINGRKQALELLEQVCREYISDQAGRSWAQFAKIMDVENLNKIDVPVDDGLYMIRLVNDPDRIHIYKRFTKTARGVFYNSYENVFQKDRTFILVQYDKGSTTDPTSGKINAGNLGLRNEEVDLIPVRKNIKVPRGMTVTPYIDMIRELASNDKFKGRYALSQSNII